MAAYKLYSPFTDGILTATHVLKKIIQIHQRAWLSFRSSLIHHVGAERRINRAQQTRSQLWADRGAPTVNINAAVTTNVSAGLHRLWNVARPVAQVLWFSLDSWGLFIHRVVVIRPNSSLFAVYWWTGILLRRHSQLDFLSPQKVLRSIIKFRRISECVSAFQSFKRAGCWTKTLDLCMKTNTVLVVLGCTDWCVFFTPLPKQYMLGLFSCRKTADNSLCSTKGFPVLKNGGNKKVSGGKKVLSRL